MLKENLKKLLPHLIAVVTFIVLSAVYFYPQLEGFQLQQGDTERAIGISKEIGDFRTKYGKEPLWTNSSFSGMPAYQISTKYSNYVTSIENGIILKPFSRPIGYVLLAMVAFYILLLCYDISAWMSLIGAVAFGFSSIFVLYLVGGHNSKVHAIALIPLVIGSLLLAYRKNYIMGALLLSFFLCLQIAANHLQMTYYSLFLIAAIVIVEFVIHLKNKLLLKFLKVSAVLVVAVILGILPTFSGIYTTYEYSKYSTRGKSELTISPGSSGTASKQSTQDALDPGYITQYNMTPGETWSLVIPNVKGGAETYIGNRKDIMENVNPQYKDYVAQYPTYWGEQEFSGGPFYFGASMFVLFMLGLIFIKDPIKWAFLAASALGVVLAWKSGAFIDFFINHFPAFNKFRDTKFTLILVQISFPFLGVLFLKEIFERKIDKKKLLYAVLAINGILLLFYVMPGAFFSFVTSAESDSFSNQLAKIGNNPEYQNQYNIFISELENARIAIFKKDVLRSLFFALTISGLVYIFVLGKLKKNYLLVGIGVLVLLDLWLVDKRLLNNEEKGNSYQMWVDKQRYYNPFRATMADNFILSNELTSNPSLRSKIDSAVNQELTKVKPQESELQKERLEFRELGFATDYRVLFAPNPFSNGEVSYFHKALGGYHGAKLKKYQELIDFYLSNENNKIINALRDSTFNNEKLTTLLRTQIPVLNMLNTKYIIYNPGAAPFVNPYTNGNCWFVKDVKYVPSADDEMLSLGKVDLKATAVVNQNFKSDIQGFTFDSTANIKLVSCLPNQLIYKSKTSSPQLAVFSEIYYPKGWNVYVDGKKTNYIPANYLLRSMSVPAGEHTIEFKFEPSSYFISEKISMASSILLIILVIGGLLYEAYKKVKA